MDLRPDPPPAYPREALPAALARAVLLGTLAGAALGGLESLKLLLSGAARYASWGAELALVALAGYALLGALTALPALATALCLWGRPGQRVAQPSACAGLGTALALAVYVATGWIGAGLLLPAVIATTLLTLALKELLGWWSLPVRTGTWWALAALAVAANAVWLGVDLAGGAARLGALLLGGVGALLVLAAPLMAPRMGHLPVVAGALLAPLLGLVLVANSPYPVGTNTASAFSSPNVLFVSIDTLRSDRLGCYGKADAGTPVIDALAAEGVLFEDTASQANTTGPSHTTMLTGLYPVQHGATSNGRRLSHRVATLPELLSQAGYQTAGFVSGFTLVDSACGLAPRFDWYGDSLLAWKSLPQVCERLRLVKSLIALAARRGERVQRSDRPAVETVDEALAWLPARPSDSRPFFLFVHLYDPHAPYEPPAPYDALHAEGWDGPGVEAFHWYELDSSERQELIEDPDALAHMLDLYQGEISYADAQLGRLIDALRSEGLYDDTLIVVTSDHGEGLGSHDYYFDHGTFLYEEELSVPLVMKLPRALGSDRAGTRVSAPVRLLDLMPTVLAVTRTEVETELSGADLSPLIEGAASEQRSSFAISDIAGDLSGFELDGRRLSLRSGGLKLIWSSPYWLDTERVPEAWQLFDLTADPDEQADRLAPGEAPAPGDGLREQLEAFRQALEALGGGEELSDEVLQHLRELGYL